MRSKPKLTRHRPAPLHVRLRLVEQEDALRSWESALGLIADDLAEHLLEKARTEASALLGEPIPAPADAEIAALVREHERGRVGEGL